MSDSRARLAGHLRSLGAEELARAMVRLGPALRYHGMPQTTEQLAQTLLVPEATRALIADLNLPQHQVMAGVVRCAKPDAQLRAAMASWGPHHGNAWLFQGKTATADVGEVLSAFGATEPSPRRDLLISALRELVSRLLIWPIGDGRLPVGDVPATIGVAGPALELLAVRQRAARRLDTALTSCFNKTEVLRIAERLGVGDDTVGRERLQASIVAHLSSPERVKALLERAPGGARDHVEHMAAIGSRMRSNVFRRANGYGAKWLIDEGYGDTDTVWLAEHGLIVPSGPEVVELPEEVRVAVAEDTRLPLSVQPAAVATVPVDGARVLAESQAAVVAAMRRLTRLMEAFDAAPVVLRKTGGMAVRETRRLARLLEVDEVELRFWIDLLAAAGLLAVVEKATPAVCPTAAYDSWLAATPEQRLAVIVRAWLGVDRVLTMWEGPGETPVPLYVIPQPHVAGLRRATLAALADVPEGAGCVVARQAARTRQMTDEEALRLQTLSTAASWHAPAPFAAIEHAPIHTLYTLYEAELLGLVALGAASPAGRAVASDVDDLAAALTEMFPAVSAKARFQADLTAVAAGTPTAELASLLDLIGDRESEGHAVVWRLSTATVRRGLDTGRDVSDLLAQLGTVAEGGLPQPVEYMIKDVARAHGKMRVVRSACCIRSDDDVLLAEMAGAKALARLGLRRIAPTVLISIRPPAETLATLRAAGYSPVLEAETGTTVVERVIGQRAPQPKRPFAGYDTSYESALATAESLLRGSTK